LDEDTFGRFAGGACDRSHIERDLAAVLRLGALKVNIALEIEDRP